MKAILKNKKGQLTLASLVPAVVLFAVAILATSLITGVVQDVADDQALNTAERNVSNNGLEGLQNLSSQFGNVGTIMAVVLIIGLLVGIFAAVRTR